MFLYHKSSWICLMYFAIDVIISSLWVMFFIIENKILSFYRFKMQKNVTLIHGGWHVGEMLCILPNLFPFVCRKILAFVSYSGGVCRTEVVAEFFAWLILRESKNKIYTNILGCCCLSFFSWRMYNIWDGYRKFLSYCEP